MLISLNSSGPSTAAGNAAALAEYASKVAAPPAAAPAPSAPAPGAAKPAPTRAALDQAVENLNKFTQMAARDLRFSVDEQTGRTVVKVVDVATDTVLRQIPNEEALALSHMLDKMHGLLVRDQA